MPAGQRFFGGDAVGGHNQAAGAEPCRCQHSHGEQRRGDAPQRHQMIHPQHGAAKAVRGEPQRPVHTGERHIIPHCHHAGAKGVPAVPAEQRHRRQRDEVVQQRPALQGLEQGGVQKAEVQQHRHGGLPHLGHGELEKMRVHTRHLMKGSNSILIFPQSDVKGNKRKSAAPETGTAQKILPNQRIICGRAATRSRRGRRAPDHG